MIGFNILFFLALLSLFLGLPPAHSKGKARAMEYLSEEAKKPLPTPSLKKPRPHLPKNRILGLSVGTLLESQNYKWTQETLRGWNMEATYLKQGKGYFGRGYHLEMQKFATSSEELTKVAFLLSMNFPNNLNFPLYMGVAAGPGLFLKQEEAESDLSFDYKGYVGLRLNRVHSQYFLQGGVKNHLHLLTDGQFIGWYLSSGVAYKF